MCKRVVLLTVVATLCLALLPLRAERVPLSKEELKAEATHVVVGKVLGIYGRDVATQLYGEGTVETHFVVDLAVESVEKGGKVESGDRVYAHCWRLKKVGAAGNRPGPSGHSIPADGEKVRAYLVAGGGGYAVVYQNGFETLDRAGK
jgi:hypothetical protein